jgi:hypothetical protein
MVKSTNKEDYCKTSSLDILISSIFSKLCDGNVSKIMSSTVELSEISQTESVFETPIQM